MGLEPLQADGLVEVTDAHIRLRPAGQLLMRAVAMALDAYLNAGNPLCKAPRQNGIALP